MTTTAVGTGFQCLTSLLPLLPIGPLEPSHTAWLSRMPPAAKAFILSPPMTDLLA